MPKLRYYLLVDHIEIQHANAISSPITYGFPAITGFLGAIHALNRKLAAGSDVFLDGTLIACHQCKPQIYRQHDFADYSFRLNRHPVKKNGATAAIVEEGKVNLDVSLVIRLSVTQGSTLDDEQEKKEFEQEIKRLLMQQRIAGGMVQHISSVELFDITKFEEIIHRLVPAFVLMDAQDELQSITKALQQDNPNATAFDALLENATLHHNPPDNDEENWSVHSVKRGRGWLVPIPLGYQSIYSEFNAGELENCRTQDYPSQYVESVYGLGKWVFPYRIKESFENSFWHYHRPEKNLYLVTQSII